MGFSSKDFTYYLLEGDSKDNTREVIESYRPTHNLFLLIDQSTTQVGSVVSGERFANLSRIGNLVLNSAKAGNDDLILWMESDLIPQQNMLKELIKWTQDINWNNTLAIAPVPTFDWNGFHQFYDTWAFEGSEGEKWGNQDLMGLMSYRNRLRPMNSIGSCALLNGKLLRKYNIDFGTGCFPELCQQGRRFGLKIYCDTMIKIAHPSQNYFNNRLI